MGWQILAMLEATPEAESARLYSPYNLSTVGGYEWYAFDLWLNLLKEISAKTGLDMVSLGMRAAERLVLPPWIENLSAALFQVEEVYRRAHRGSECGEVFARVVHGRHIRFTVRTPYPEEFIFGLVWGIAQRYAPENNRLELTRHSADRGTTFDVRW